MRVNCIEYSSICRNSIYRNNKHPWNSIGLRVHIRFIEYNATSLLVYRHHKRPCNSIGLRIVSFLDTSAPIKRMEAFNRRRLASQHNVKAILQPPITNCIQNHARAILRACSGSEA
ncbi:hypothetical protein [Marinomonas sp.]|uniref:hypothetical protein n=1 Tax=Marinomonas sp. TaxID=1904862 RepID=UPI003BA9E5C2